MMTIDLSGPQGNAYFLLGVAKQLMIRNNFLPAQVENVLDEMKSGDYNNLCNVFEKNFSDYVELI